MSRVFVTAPSQIMSHRLPTIGVASDSSATGKETRMLNENDGTASGRTGFILMPFVADLEWLHHTVKNAGKRAGVAMRRADDIAEPGVVIEQVKTAIESADVVVAVCTGQNANVFFEMGLAWRQHRPVLVAEDTVDLPFDVRHFRTELYGRAAPGQDRATLEDRLVRAIEATPSTLPLGRRLSTAPDRKATARVSVRLVDAGRGRRLSITNSGTEDLHDLRFAVPPAATSFLVHADELPIDVLRPGESVSFIASVVMGGGARIFDVTITASLSDGSPFEQLVKLSL